MPKSSRPPLTHARIKSRKPSEPRGKFPLTKVELCRLWHKDGELRMPTVQHVAGDASYTIVEAIIDPKSMEGAPSIRTEDLRRKAKRARFPRGGAISEGAYERFLGKRYVPTKVREIRRRRRKGDDNPASVFGADTRYIFNDTAFPWCTAGRVASAGGIGAGCMIGRNLLLTCSHTIRWNDDNTAGWVRFEPSYYNGPRAQFGSAWGTRTIFWRKNQGGLSDTDTAFDYVVVVLDRNLGDLTGYPGYRTYSKSWNDGRYWQHIGYPGDKTGTLRPVFFGGGAFNSVGTKSVSGQKGYVMGHFMDITAGHSGGPYWGWWSGEPWPRVVGVQSAEASKPSMDTSGDNEAGGGPALSKLIAYARSNF